MKVASSKETVSPITHLFRGSVLKSWGMVFVGLMGLLIFVNSLKYFGQTDIGFLAHKKEAIRSGFYLPAFYAHISTAAVALFLSLFQLQPGPIQRHRFMGKLYVVLVLSIAAPSGLVMACFSTGGWKLRLCFVLLSALWWYFSFQGWQEGRQKKLNAHRRFMYRSFALCLSAPLLRLYSFLSVALFNWSGAEAYLVLSCLSWVPNLLVLEIYFVLRKKYQPLKY